MTSPTITLGMRLALARKHANLTAKEMARMTGYSEKSISRFENDREPVPTAVLYIYQHECGVSREFIEGREALTQEVVTSRCMTQLPLWALYGDAA